MKKSLFVSFLSKLAARYMIMGMTKVRCKDLSFHIKRVKSSVKIPNSTSSLSNTEDFFFPFLPGAIIGVWPPILMYTYR